MPLFTIMHIFEVPAKNQIVATDELMIARQNHFEKTFLKKVIAKKLSQNFPGIKSMSLHKNLPDGAQFSSGRLPAASDAGECVPRARLAPVGSRHALTERG